MNMNEAEVRIVEVMPQSTDLADGEVAVHLGCAACPHAVDLVTEAEAGDVLTGLSADIPRKVKTNQAGWDRSGSAACSNPGKCPHEEQILGLKNRSLRSELNYVN